MNIAPVGPQGIPINPNPGYPPTVCEEYAPLILSTLAKVVGCAALIFSALESPLIFLGTVFAARIIKDESPSLHRELESITRIFWTARTDIEKCVILSCAFLFKPISTLFLSIYAGIVTSQVFLDNRQQAHQA